MGVLFYLKTLHKHSPCVSWGDRSPQKLIDNFAKNKINKSSCQLKLNWENFSLRQKSLLQDFPESINC